MLLLDPMRLQLIFVALVVLGCGGRDEGVEGSPDAAVEAPAQPWNDRQKCEHMCQAYCVQKFMCDGSSVDACRRALDEADGGSCAERAELFAEIPQAKVEACIAAVEAMSCADFLRMFNSGTGIPPVCNGILR